MKTYDMNAFGISPEILSSLASGDRRGEMVVVVLMEGVESLCVRIADQVIKMLRLSKPVLRTRGCVVVGRKGRREVRRLEV